MTKLRSLIINCLLLSLVTAADYTAENDIPQKPTAVIAVDDSGDNLRVEAEGQLLAVYNYQDVAKPFFYPVIGPTGSNMTRHWPMSEEGEREEHDHPHHTGLYFTHGDVNGHDFWLDGEGTGKIVHNKFLGIKSEGNVATVESTNRWVAASGEVVCTDRRIHRFEVFDEALCIDFEITIRASEKRVTFGDTKEGTMAIRLPATMRVEGKVGKGHIINSEGFENTEAWGKRAKWVDYHGPLNKEIVGVAIFDHPQNPRHPTWWHVRTYGLFAANPFGRHHFENKEEGGGDLIIERGESVTFRYRFYFHRGDEKEGNVERQYKEYAQKQF